MNYRDRGEPELDGIMAFGHDPEQRTDNSDKKVNHSNGADAPCHGCYAHFTPMEMGIMGSPSKSCMHFDEWIQLCVSCMDKEIIRIAHTLGIPDDKAEDIQWISANVLVFAKTTDIKSDVMSIEKLLFLLHAKKVKNK